MFSLPVVLLLATWSASRPPECVEAGSNVWERAKSPVIRSYCDTLASGTAKLGGTLPAVRDAIVLADDAERLLPGRAAPLPTLVPCSRYGTCWLAARHCGCGSIR